MEPNRFGIIKGVQPLFATATTAASGRNREELLGPRPARCECRSKARSRCRVPQPEYFQRKFHDFICGLEVSADTSKPLFSQEVPKFQTAFFLTTFTVNTKKPEKSADFSGF